MAYPQYPAAPAPPQPLFAGPPPVQVAVRDPRPQNRVTVLFRVFMAIPHFIVLVFLAIAAWIVAFLGWWGALFTGRLPGFAVSYLTGFVRWAMRVYAYMYLLTDSYPPFSLDDMPDYPVRIATTRERLNRAAVFFRFILAIPVSILNGIVTYGAGTIVLFITWLIALVTGKLPVSLHLAYAAVLRFQARVLCYLFMLTPAYPGGLFGDGQAGAAQSPGMPPAPGAPGGYPGPGGYGPQAGGYGIPADDGAPTDPGYGQRPPAAPGYGTPPYGTPGPASGAPGGYGSPPGGYGSPPGGYGSPPGGYGAPGGYGTPPYGTPGPVSGAPGGYGTPSGGYSSPPGVYDPPQAAEGWRLFLTPAAKRLVVLFIVLGALTYVGQLSAQQSVAGSGSVNAGNGAKATAASRAMQTALGKLAGEVSQFQSTTNACGSNLSCVEAADGKAAGYFGGFGSTVRATAMPPNATAAAGQLSSDATKIASDYTQLSHAAGAGQYESLATGTGLQQDSRRFDADASALQSLLARGAS